MFQTWRAQFAWHWAYENAHRAIYTRVLLVHVDMFIQQIEDKGESMPPEKQQALDLATS